MSTILVVEDSQVALLFIKTVLEQAGHRVIDAQGGSEALRKVAELEPGCMDLGLIDVRMPVMDGFSLFGELKECCKDHRPPILFMSASSDWQDKAQGIKLGAADFLVKPFVKEELLQRVEINLTLAAYQKREERILSKRSALQDVIRILDTLVDSVPALGPNIGPLREIENLLYPS